MLSTEIEIFKQGKYTLYRSEKPLLGNKYVYVITDEDGDVKKRWDTQEEILPTLNPQDEEKFYNSDVYVVFQATLNKLSTKDNKAVDTTKWGKNKWWNSSEDDFSYDDLDDFSYNEYKDLPPVTSKNVNKSTSSYKSAYSYSYQPTYKKGYVEKYNNSDTLVFHKADPTTTMLSQIYEGKGWDVITDTDVDPAEVKELMQSHERIVCLGHGHSGGLCGGMITDREAPYFKDKKIFAIWCNADAYFAKHNIGKGQFITGNMPSEVWECQAAGCGEISRELMLENITYWSKLCADHVEDCLNGNVHEAIADIRIKYLSKYGDHAVTVYNAERTQAFQEPDPLPEYDCKGVHYTKDNLPKPIIQTPKYTSKTTNSYSSNYKYTPPKEDLTKYPKVLQDIAKENNISLRYGLVNILDSYAKKAVPKIITDSKGNEYKFNTVICELRNADKINDYSTQWNDDFISKIFTVIYVSTNKLQEYSLTSDVKDLDLKTVKDTDEFKEIIKELVTSSIEDLKNNKKELKDANLLW